MAHSITIRTQSAGYTSGYDPEVDEVSVSTFMAGQDRGRMVQVTLGDTIVSMTRASAKVLASVIDFAADHSLGEYPRFVN